MRTDCGVPRTQVTVAGFSEEDQAALYNIAHGTKTTGKQGLGTGSRPKKARGNRGPPPLLSSGLHARQMQWEHLCRQNIIPA